ncbi:MAG: prephenate dehydrogenase [Actinomycetes bacterium]
MTTPDRLDLSAPVISSKSSLAGSVLVVGSGLIGASLGLALTARGVSVWLEDLDSEAGKVAASRGAGRLGTPDVAPELIFVAVPPHRTAEVISRLMTLYLDATVSDVSSTKTQLQQDVESLGADMSRFVPGHPLAGREVSGPSAARADLFADRIWALTPSAQTDPTRTALVASVVRSLGAVVVETSPEQHDRAVALTSHTPQIVASMVAAGLTSLDDAEVRLSGQGLRDVTRLAGSDPQLWTEILASNAVPVAQSLGALIDRLREVRDALISSPPERDRLGEALTAGVLGHARVPGKHGATPVNYAVVPVVVADRPGELGRLFAAVGGTGVNLEDVRIEHIQGRPTGLVELEVRPEAADQLAAGLRLADWEVRF